MPPHPEEDPSPRYLRATSSSKTSSSSQHFETNRVANSFRGSNFLSLASLPASLRPGAVEDSRRRGISAGRSAKVEPGAPGGGGHLFTPLSYRRDEYKKVLADEKRHRQHQQLTELSFSRKPFTYASSRIRLKNEDIFGDEKYKFPVLGPGSGVAELETVVRQDFTDPSKMLHGPFFVPARVQAEHPRDELELWGREIYDQLRQDWGHLRFSLRCTGEEELSVAFDMTASMTRTSGSGSTRTTQRKGQEEGEEGVCNPVVVTALSRYMNTMARHGVAAHRRLRKRGDRWKVFELEPEVGKSSHTGTTGPNVGTTGPTGGGGADTGTTTATTTGNTGTGTTDNGTTGGGTSGTTGTTDAGKRVCLVFSFYTPWYTSAQRNIQKSTARLERVAVRRTELHNRAATAAERDREVYVLAPSGSSSSSGTGGGERAASSANRGSFSMAFDDSSPQVQSAGYNTTPSSMMIGPSTSNSPRSE